MFVVSALVDKFSFCGGAIDLESLILWEGKTPPWFPSYPVYLYYLGRDLDRPVVFKLSLVLLLGESGFY